MKLRVWREGRENRIFGIDLVNLLEERFKFWSLFIFLICFESLDLKELFFNEIEMRLFGSEGNLGLRLLFFKFSFWRLDNFLRLKIELLRRLFVKIRFFRFFKEEIFFGIFLDMKLELRLRDWREGGNLVMILGERGLDILSEVRYKVFKFGSFVRRVKSFLNFLESLLVLFLVMVNFVMWFLEYRILKEGEEGRL